MGHPALLVLVCQMQGHMAEPQRHLVCPVRPPTMGHPALLVLVCQTPGRMAEPQSRLERSLSMEHPRLPRLDCHQVGQELDQVLLQDD